MNTQEWILTSLEGRQKGEAIYALVVALEKGDFSGFWKALPDGVKASIIKAGTGEIAKVYPAAAPILGVVEALPNMVPGG